MDVGNLLWAGVASVVGGLVTAVVAQWRRSGTHHQRHLTDVERLLRERIESRDARIRALEKENAEVTRKYERTCTKLAAAIERLSEVVDDGR